MSLDDPKLHEALAAEAERLGCIDLDILQAFPEEIAGAKLDASGAPDVASIVGAIRKIKTRSPALFKTQDFEKMDAASYKSAEDAFREKLRRRSQQPARSNEYKTLDAALLTPEEGHALRRYLGGTRNSYDRSVLNAALTRQTGPRGDAA
jgi:hypothetical protein